MSQAELAIWGLLFIAILGMGWELFRRTRSPLIAWGGVVAGAVAVVIGRLIAG